jgi:hypothetical protein
MSVPKLFLIVATVVFAAIGVAFLKKSKVEAPTVVGGAEQTLTLTLKVEEEAEPAFSEETLLAEAPAEDTWANLPRADRIDQLFNTSGPKAPIVKTVTYKSRVSWLQGRPAWVADYAKHFNTSRHFIARSLNGGADYFSQNVSNGDRFNVLDETKDVRFHLVVDASRCHAWLYYYDAKADEHALLKDYVVGLGRPDPRKASGCLTPLGKYTLGERVAIYKPQGMGWFNGEKVEMVRTFGTRWIPFEDEVAQCTAPAKGFGVHGAPWSEDSASGELVELRECIGHYESDGCIRFVTEDIEEIFAIVITHPTTIEIVKRFEEAQLPGKEVEL